MPFKNPHPLYGVWQGMRRRCLTPTYRQWSDYGGRGITICPEWDNFDQFVIDMGPRPSPKHSLDRRDNDGNYEPANCRWATRKEQQSNRRNTRRVTIEGQSYLVAELVGMTGLKHETIIARAEKGMAYAELTKKTRYNFTGGIRRAIEVRVANQLAKTHCKHGHEWTEWNTRITKEGWKYCRQCHNAKMRRLGAIKRSNAREENSS